jgi:hypothetical protein
MTEKHDRQKNSGKPEKTKDRNRIADLEDVCEKAPEWAEHHRLRDEDQPCDDGRSGKI